MPDPHPSIPPSDPGASRRRLLPGLLIIVLMTLVAYLPAMNGGYIWDDDDYVTGNTNLHDFDGLRKIWRPGTTHQYYPVVFTTFWVEYQLWQLDPLGYHIVNVLLHIAVALLIWRLMSLLHVPGAWMIAAVFALHPVHVESVAWITERKNVLSGLFYFLAALAYLRFDPIHDRPAREPAEGRRWDLYALALVFFVCALLSKSVTCSLPAALILVMLYRRQPLTLKRLLPLATLFVIGLAAALHTAHLEKVNVGAEGAEFDFTFIERCLIASRALLFYPWKLLWPHPLVFMYRQWTIDAGDWMSYWSIAIVLAAAVGAIVLFVKGKRGPAIAAAFYAGTIFPALGFFNVYPMRYSFVADHFNYLASLGLITLLIGVLTPLARRLRLAAPIAAIVLLSCAVLVWREGPKYENVEVLWRQTIADNPRAWMAQNNLGAILLRRDENDRAIEHILASLEVNPDHYEAHGNLALALDRKGLYDESLAEWELVIRHDRAVAQDHYRMGQTLEHAGRIDEAMARYREGLELLSDHLATHLRLGELLIEADRADEAQAHFEYIVQRDPSNTRLQRYLGGRAETAGEYARAIGHYEAGLGHASEGAESLGFMVRLAKIRAMCPDRRFRDPNQAIGLCRRMLEVTGSRDPFVLNILAAAFAGLGRFDEARRLAEEALPLARQAEQPQLVAELEARLAAYQAGQADPP